MKGSLNASSSSVSGSNASNGRNGEVQCHCGKLSVVKKSMTDDNPQRRFYSCCNPKWSSCNFFKWYDVEKPHGWQKKVLVEARDIIRDQIEELKKLKARVGHDNVSVSMEIEQGDQDCEVCSKLEDENKKLKQDLRLSIEKEKLLREFVIISWIGFVCVIVVIVNALK